MSYKTAWRMRDLLRDAMPEPGSDELFGNMELQRRSSRTSVGVSDGDAGRDNLPTPLTRFIGREREVATVRRLMDDARLVTLVGAGGCGKTRLALHVSGSLVGCYRDGVWWVDLAALTPERSVAVAVADVVGLRCMPSQSMGELVDHLRERHTLLVLDNCEHLLASCAKVVNRLLTACQGVRILVTSREPVGVGGESVSMPSSDWSRQVKRPRYAISSSSTSSH